MEHFEPRASLAIEGVSCLWVHPTVSDTWPLHQGKSRARLSAMLETFWIDLDVDLVQFGYLG